MLMVQESRDMQDKGGLVMERHEEELASLVRTRDANKRNTDISVNYGATVQLHALLSSLDTLSPVRVVLNVPSQPPSQG